MSIGAIGGVSPVQGRAAAGSVGKPEAGEAGVPDHDGDADDAGAKVSPASAPRATVAGRVDVKG